MPQDYHQDVFQQWKGGKCLDEIQKRLDTLKSHLKRIMEMDNPWLERQNNQ